MSLTNTLTEEEEEEEDTELRDLVTNVLKQKGVLGRMKVKKETSVFSVFNIIVTHCPF